MGRKAVPWRITDPKTEQIEFIQMWQEGGVDFVTLCRKFGISRKTGYKRVQRFNARSWDGLGDWSRAPHSHPNRTERVVAERIITLRRERPTWGPKKLVAWLRNREPGVLWPAPSTAGDLLGRVGLVQRRKGRRRSAPWSQPLASAEEPNDLWCVDFKGWFRTGDGVRVDPLTVADAASRYLLACQGLEKPRGPEVRRVMERTFREHGLPWAIRSDNGPPFASTGLGGLSPLVLPRKDGGSSWESCQNGPSRGIRNRTGGWRGCTGRLRRRRPVRPRQPWVNSNGPSMASGPATMRNGPMRHWGNSLRPSVTGRRCVPIPPGWNLLNTGPGPRCGE